MAKPKHSAPDAAWNISFQLAKEYFIEHGHLMIPKDYLCDGQRLGRWIGTQRSDYHKRTNPFFTQERIVKLESINMAWDVKDAAWNAMYRELEKYCHQYGTAKVPQSYITPDGKHLGLWINRQRIKCKCNAIMPERKLQLERLGMIWDAELLRRGGWNAKFEILGVYVVDNNGKFPAGNYVTENGIKLGQWLNNQRQYYRRGKLLPHRKDKLEKLGIVWDVLEQCWEDWYQQAKVYSQNYGNLCFFIQKNGQGSKSLEVWLSNQRFEYGRGKLLPERIQKLENIGMVWNVLDHQWDRMYWREVAFYQKYGHLRTSKTRGVSEDYKLGEWLSTQRKNYFAGTNLCFTEERIWKLEEIGMVWDASIDSQAVWEDWYSTAEKFYQEQGHLKPAEGRLRTWLMAQRSAKKGKRGCLSSDQIRRLEQIGMEWSPIEEAWDKMYQYAKEYYGIHQILNIPCTYVT